MTVYPFKIDDDQTIFRIDDNLSEIGTEVINQLRSATFAIEKELGITPSGSLSSVSDRLDVSLNPNGTIKSSALTSVGLVTLPIDDAQVGASAGIKETKLSLDFSTASLNAQVQSNLGTINTISSFTSVINSNLLSHISGGNLADGSNGRHVSSQIDLNATPFDSRDPAFIWTGLFDKNGVKRTATTVAGALLQINDAFVDHQLNETGEAHFATGISVDTSSFLLLPQSADTVQKAINAIDNADALVIQQHQQNLHSNGIPKESRTTIVGDVDGYSWNIIPPTPATALLINPPATNPVDNNITGDDIIKLNPDNTDFIFDSQFAKVQVGDVVRINYGNGLEGVFNVESKRHIPNVDWVIRINGVNLSNADGYSASVRVDRRRIDTNKYGTLAVAPANNNIDNSIMSSVIIGDPKGAQALGLAFDPTQLNSDHYNLYLSLYPTGNPEDVVIDLPAIDVTGDAGISPGKYTINTVVETVNDAFRSAGYNYRFIAFERDGEFGIMLADSISNASFSILNGEVSAGSLVEGSFLKNVVGDATDGRDALGFGATKAGIASPKYSGSFTSGLAARTFPTVIFRPLDKRHFVANGISRDSFAVKPFTLGDGYWDGYISDRLPVGATTVETTYQVNKDLSSAGLEAGKTIVIQPAIDRSNPLFSDVDYGRFVIKEISFKNCPGDEDITSIKVVNSLHATASPIGTSAFPPLNVKLYFSEDSVSFNNTHVSDALNGNDYLRFHEIYANELGKTFSHERARLPVQNEGVNLLNTNSGFKITDVSPKLKGFLDDDTETDRFVRFYVLNYNSTSGEYDGYIGRRTSGTSNIQDFGRIITARKNIPTRFYDASDIDYVEIVYKEDDIYPGTSIMSTNSPRYVDIELFDSLSVNQENIILAGCTLSTITNRVDCVKDLRQFGNVSEIDFTDSAIRFIESGDRFLHSNGVITGFTFIGEDASLPGTLAFNGGIALVNGHMSTLNSQTITIPEIVQDTGAGQVTNLDWAICVNDSDKLQAIPLTNTKTQFFARRSGDVSNYYIPSVTFNELVDNRRDLTLLQIVNVTIASTTVNSVLDARKMVVNETNNIPLSLSDNPNVGAFTNFEQVKTWANNTSNNKLVVNIRDNFTINSEVDLTGVSNLVLQGDGGTITVNSETGLILKSGITIKDINFVYNYNLSPFDANDLSHLVLENSCIKLTEEASDIIVEGCTFSQETSGERYPYIGVFSPFDSGFIKNIKFIKNKFKESFNSFNCAIGFIQTNDPGGGFYNRTTLENVDIVDNIIEGNQSILIVGEFAEFQGADIDISRNFMINGFIGYNIDNFSNQPVAATTLPYRNIIVEHNLCKAIFVANSQGKSDVSPLTDISQFISNNHCNYIGVASGNHLVISDNEIESSISSDFTNVITNSASIDVYGADYFVIRDNTIDNIDLYGKGIFIHSSADGRIIGNKIERGSGGSAVFIDVSPVTNRSIHILENNLSHTTTSSIGTENTILYDDEVHFVDRNVNHIKEIVLRNMGMYFGPVTLVNSIVYRKNSDLAYPGLFEISSFESSIRIELIANESAVNVLGQIPLASFAPPGSVLEGFKVDYNVGDGTGWPVNSEVDVYASRADNIGSGSPSFIVIPGTVEGNLNSTPSDTLSATGLDPYVINDWNVSLRIACRNLASTDFSFRTLNIEDITIRYTYV